MRLALLYQDGNFVGREYLAAMNAAGFVPEVVIPVGRMKDQSIAIEKERTGGLWNPPPVRPSAITRSFDEMADPALVRLLRESAIDVAVQGGIGVLRGELLAAPNAGWLNVHPGKLPQYRGNACPEWALLNGDPVFATAHFIDEGIDTGPVVCEGQYDFSAARSYFEFRAQLYRHCAGVLIDALGRLRATGGNPRSAALPQSPKGARYWPPLGEREREAVRKLFPSTAGRIN